MKIRKSIMQDLNSPQRKMISNISHKQEVSANNIEQKIENSDPLAVGRLPDQPKLIK